MICGRLLASATAAVQALRTWVHTHRWRETVWNGFATAVEEQCRCGAARHHFARDVDWGGADAPRTHWRDGLHPNRPSRVKSVTPDAENPPPDAS